MWAFQPVRFRARLSWFSAPLPLLLSLSFYLRVTVVLPRMKRPPPSVASRSRSNKKRPYLRVLIKREMWLGSGNFGRLWTRKNIHLILGTAMSWKIILSDLEGFFVDARWWNSEAKNRTETRTETRPNTMAKQKTRVTKSRPVLPHWCHASRVRRCGKADVLISTRCIRCTLSVWSDSGRSCTFLSAHMTLRHCEPTPGMSQMQAGVILSHSVWPPSRSIFDLRPSPSDSMETNY